MYNAIKETISVIYETSAAKGFFSTHFLFLGGGATLPPSRIKKKLRKRAHECRCVFLMWRVASTNGSEASPSSIIGGTSFLGQLAFHWLFFVEGHNATPLNYKSRARDRFDKKNREHTLRKTKWRPFNSITFERVQ